MEPIITALLQLYKRKLKILRDLKRLIGTEAKRGPIHNIIGEQAIGYTDKGRIFVNHFKKSLLELEEANKELQRLEIIPSKFDTVILELYADMRRHMDEEHEIFVGFLKEAIIDILDRKDWHDWLENLEHVDNFMVFLEEDIILFNKLLKEISKKRHLIEIRQEAVLKAQEIFFHDMLPEVKKSALAHQSYSGSKAERLISFAHRNRRLLNPKELEACEFLVPRIIEGNLESAERMLVGETEATRAFDHLKSRIDAAEEFRKIIRELRQEAQNIRKGLPTPDLPDNDFLSLAKQIYISWLNAERITPSQLPHIFLEFDYNRSKMGELGNDIFIFSQVNSDTSFFVAIIKPNGIEGLMFPSPIVEYTESINLFFRSIKRENAQQAKRSINPLPIKKIGDRTWQIIDDEASQADKSETYLSGLMDAWRKSYSIGEFRQNIAPFGYAVEAFRGSSWTGKDISSEDIWIASKADVGYVFPAYNVSPSAGILRFYGVRIDIAKHIRNIKRLAVVRKNGNTWELIGEQGELGGAEASSTPETFAQLERIGFEILDEIYDNRRHPLASLSTLREWIRSKYPTVKIEPITNWWGRGVVTEVDFMLIDYWRLISLTIDGEHGVLIPGMDLIIGTQFNSLYCFEGRYDGTKSLWRGEVEKLPKIEHKEDANTKGKFGWTCIEKGRINLDVQYREKTASTNPPSPTDDPSAHGSYTIEEIYSAKVRIMEQINSFLTFNRILNPQTISSIQRLLDPLRTLEYIAFAMKSFCDMFLDYSELRNINSDLSIRAGNVIKDIIQLQIGSDDRTVQMIIGLLFPIVDRKDLGVPMGLKTDIELYNKSKLKMKGTIDKFGVLFLKNRSALIEHMQIVKEKVKVAELEQFTKIFKEYMDHFKALTEIVEDSDWRNAVNSIYQNYLEYLRPFEEILAGRLPLTSEAIKKVSIVSLRDLTIALVDLWDRKQVTYLENPSIKSHIEKMAGLAGLKMVFPKRGETINYQTMEFEPVGVRSEFPRDTVVRTLRVGWLYGDNLFRRARVDRSAGNPYS